MELYEEQPQQDEPDPELRKCQPAKGDTSYGEVEPTISLHRGEHTGDDAADDAGDHCVDGELESCWKPTGQVGCHRVARYVGETQIAVNQVAEKSEVLLDHWLIQTERSCLLNALGLRSGERDEQVDWVRRQDVHRDERQRDDAPNDRQGPERPYCELSPEFH